MRTHKRLWAGWCSWHNRRTGCHPGGLDKLEKWAQENLRRLNKSKCYFWVRAIPDMRTDWEKKSQWAAQPRRMWWCWWMRNWMWCVIVCSHPRKPVVSWHASKAAWPARWGRWFCLSALLCFLSSCGSSVLIPVGVSCVCTIWAIKLCYFIFLKLPHMHYLLYADIFMQLLVDVFLLDRRFLAMQFSLHVFGFCFAGFCFPL